MIETLQNVIKTNTQPQQQQPRVVLAGPGTQPGQFSQQIILPANFQGIKTLQGLKVIPMGQQGELLSTITQSSLFLTISLPLRLIRQSLRNTLNHQQPNDDKQ